MTPEVKRHVSKIVNQIEGLKYWEALDIINSLSVQIFVCAPGNNGELAIEECHRVQKLAFKDYLNEKEKQKGIVDKAIIDFSQYAKSESEVGSVQPEEEQKEAI